MIIQILTIITLLITVNYCWIIISYTFGLRKLVSDSKVIKSVTGNHHSISSKIIQQTRQEITTNHKSFVSVIISARNEEKNIKKCLECLAKQDYNNEYFEVLIINDHSSDKTVDIIKTFILNGDIDVKLLHSSDTSGKKAALSAGYKVAKGELILTTDADCEVQPSWISAMNSAFNSSDALLITGPVMMFQGKGCFNKFQCIEFNSLIASTAGSIGLNRPIMSNGANMGFKRAALNELQMRTALDKTVSNPMQNQRSSGDDVFLMLAFKNLFGKKSISFLNNPETVVYTFAQNTLKQFISQRLRWVSKSGGYRDPQVIYTALSIFIFNLLMLLLVPAILILFFQNSYLVELLLKVLLVIFSLKTIVDYLLLYEYSSLFGQKKLLPYLFIFEPLVILYTVLVGILGNFLTFSWKGRIYKK